MDKTLKISGILIITQWILIASLFATEKLTASGAKCFNRIETLAGIKICGRDFWFALRDLPVYKKFANDPLFQETGLWGRFNKSTFEKGTKENKPVILFIHYTDKEKEILKLPEIQKMRYKTGEQFIGMTHLEGIWNVVKPSHTKNWPKLLNQKFPQTKEESYQLIKNYFHKNILLDGLPICPGSIGFLDHHTLSWGANATTSYWGSNLLFAQIQAAFSRGASRQFKRPWNVYYATYGLCCKSGISEGILKNITIDDSLKFNLRAPELVQTSKGNNSIYYKGAYCGADIKTTVRPNYYYAYMSGVNLLENESDSEFLRYAAYDTKSKREAPLVRKLRDERIFLSPMSLLQKEVNEYAKREPRGIPYTPFAILLDRHHGYIYPGRKTYFTFAALENGDKQINALFNVLFPFNDSMRNLNLTRKAKSIEDVPAEQSCFINLPYGNLFDVLTNEVSEEILQAYPALIIAGKHNNPDLKEKLLKYVYNGGTLVLAADQIPTNIPPEFHNIHISKELLHGKGFIDDNGSNVSEKDFSFYNAKPFNGARCIYKESESKLPLIISNDYGKGKVIVCTTPYFLNNEKEMLNIFDLLLKTMISEIMPIQIKMLNGRIDFSLNKVGDYYLATLINYDGIKHSIGKSAEIDKSKTAKLILTAQDENINMFDTLTQKAVLTEKESGKTSATLEIEPGSLMIVKIDNSKTKGK